MKNALFLAVMAALIRVAAGQQISSLAGSFDSIAGIALDGEGNVYIADNVNSVIRKLAPSGELTTVAGNGQLGASPRDVNTEGRPATSVALGPIRGIATDAAGNLLISVSQALQKVDARGALTTLVGLGNSGVEGSAPRVSGAAFGVAVDTVGNIYFSALGMVRRLDTMGNVTVVAGKPGTASSTGDGGPATAATLNNPEAIAIDRAGNLYISELLGQHIRKVTPGGIISTVLGQAGTGFAGDNGAASQAKYSGNSPALATDASGNLYIADGARVRRISTDGVITTFAGTGERGFGGDNGRPNLAVFGSITALAFDTAGDLYIGDPNNKRVRKITFGVSAGAQPVIAPGGVLNAASFAKEITPGSLVTIFGSDLAGGAAVADRLPLPLTLAGASVKVGGFPAPLIYVSATQINLQLPYEARGGAAPVVVTTAAGDSVPVLAQVVAEAPGILTYGVNRAVAQNQDGTLNDQAHPAKAGSVMVVYMTGAGLVSNAPATGAAAPSNPIALMQSKVAATVGGLPCVVQFAGLAPGYVGLVQLNITVPALAGDFPLVVTFGSTASNAPTVSVQR
ncbi:MAG TPA: hypothetical protein VLJ39_07270 [Tepidisphaeraceae bacterium]|nr:hypothetical protein [Tepidisphaeraceae bacterium]